MRRSRWRAGPLAATFLAAGTGDGEGGRLHRSDGGARVNREISPRSIAAPAANYAHAVRVETPTAWLFTSGVVPVAPDGTVPADVGSQAEVVWSNIEAMLAEASMVAADVVSVSTYVVAGEPLGPVMAARDRALGGHRAASTLVTVPALAQPAWRVEVAVIAAT